MDKQGDFFTDSAVILLAAIIWYLKIYDNGRYCTFPHAIEFLCQPLDKIFPILSSYPELENYLSPFVDAWKSNAQDQLQGTGGIGENSPFAHDLSAALLGAYGQ